MRTYPKDKDLTEVKDLKAKQWQIDLLKMNPDYVYWGNFEDYMCKDNGGWDSRVNLKSWSERFGLDDLNELVNFYFEVYRPNHDCPYCDGSGMNEATNQISEDFYDFANRGAKWCDNITQDEVEALQEVGRLRVWEDRRWVKKEGLTADEVNAANRTCSVGLHNFAHDAINRWILIETRAKRLGVYGPCKHCEGGLIYDKPQASVALQLWYLHPRKGCSRGVYIEHIEREEIPSVIEYLKEAAQRNANRFSKL